MKRFAIIFDLILSENEIRMIYTAKSPKGARRKFTNEWGNNYKIKSLTETKQ